MVTYTQARADFPSRLSIRGVVSGVVCAFSSLLLLMLIASGFGLWRFNTEPIATVGAGFLVWLGV